MEFIFLLISFFCKYSIFKVCNSVSVILLFVFFACLYSSITLEVPATADCQVSVEWIKLEEGGSVTSWIANENDSDGVNLLENASFDSNGTGYPESYLTVGTTGTYGGWFIGTYGSCFTFYPYNLRNNNLPECFSVMDSTFCGMFLVHQDMSEKITSDDIGKYFTISINGYFYGAKLIEPTCFRITGLEYNVVYGSLNMQDTSSTSVSLSNAIQHYAVIKITNITNPDAITIGLQIGDGTNYNYTCQSLFNHFKVEKGYNPNPDWGDPVTGDVGARNT